MAFTDQLFINRSLKYHLLSWSNFPRYLLLNNYPSGVRFRAILTLLFNDHITQKLYGNPTTIIHYSTMSSYLLTVLDQLMQ